jgi:hypothetical protein
MKRDFSQNLIDVKSSIINPSYTGVDDDATSTPDIEYMNNSNDGFDLQAEEEKFSTISKNTYLNL